MYDAQPVPSGLDTDAALEWLTTEAATASLWQMTAQVLKGRVGWTLNSDEEGVYAWFFGLEGQALLVVSVEPYGLHCYHHSADTDDTVNSARELWDWATAREEAELAAGAEHLLYMHKEIRAMHDERLRKELGDA